MTDVTSHYVHFLLLRDLGQGPGWYTPYELKEHAPSGYALALPVPGSEPFSEYWLEVRYGDGASSHIAPMILRSTGAGTYSLECSAFEAPFRERHAGDGRRGYHYLGDLYHPDFAYELVEVEPAYIDDIYDHILEQMGATLIGCYPFNHYRDRNGNQI